jgi:Flp pilus assembly protein TadB
VSRRSQRLAADLETRSGGGEAFAPNGASPTTAGTTAPTSAWNPPAQDLTHQPVTQVLQKVTEESKTLISEELQLARTELTSKVKTAGKGAGLLGAAAVAAVFGAMALTAAIILALALVMPPWAAALVVAAAYLAIAAVLALTGRTQVQAASPFLPERAVRTLNDVIQRIQSAWKRGESRP